MCSVVVLTICHPGQAWPPPPPKRDPNRPPVDRSVFMDPIEVGEYILRGIKRNDLFIMSHPEFREGIIARNEALLRSIPDEPPNKKRYNVIKTFGRIYHNPIYDEQTTPGPQEWKKEKLMS